MRRVSGAGVGSAGARVPDARRPHSLEPGACGLPVTTATAWEEGAVALGAVPPGAVGLGTSTRGRFTSGSPVGEVEVAALLVTAAGAVAVASSDPTSHTLVTTTGVDELAWAARSCRGLVRAAREEEDLTGTQPVPGLLRNHPLGPPLCPWDPPVARQGKVRDPRLLPYLSRNYVSTSQPIL